ncbi:hypothetical protein LOAG_06598 [Loa loa]|uniref:Uncharacterized protein n=1 Tax=Loa loa TaxID=7209 RepID=A0A1S0TYC3_LOALO|nr:hypothetical protein LOAG_06598 [Loa loa]EFO21885.1 hypothetical protein LOAG_06598 [Loa loa]
MACGCLKKIKDLRPKGTLSFKEELKLQEFISNLTPYLKLQLSKIKPAQHSYVEISLNASQASITWLAVIAWFWLNHAFKFNNFINTRWFTVPWEIKARL